MTPSTKPEKSDATDIPLDKVSGPSRGKTQSISPDELAAMAVKYKVGSYHRCSVYVEKREGIERERWAITSRGHCLNKQGGWDHEPIPSSRDAAFLSANRFSSAEKAIIFYRKWLAKNPEKY